MANKELNALIETGFRLSKSAPSAWAEFMTAYRAYVTEQVEDCTKAPSGEALTAHGRGQAYLSLRGILADLETTYKKLHP